MVTISTRPSAPITVKMNSINKNNVNIQLNPVLSKVINQLNNITDIDFNLSTDNVGQSYVIYNDDTGKFVVSPINLNGGEF